MKPITGPAQGVPPFPEDDGQQLSLLVFASLDRMQGTPPDKALWREALDLGIATIKRFVHNGYPVSASAVHHVGEHLYFLANPAGIINDPVTGKPGMPIEGIARTCRVSVRTAKTALAVLCRLRVVKQIRTSRRRSAIWTMNLGGLTWSAGVARLRRARQISGSETPLLDASGVMVTPLSGVTITPPRRGTYGEISTARAAADRPARAREAAHRQEQQPDRSAPDGLITAIAARSREHDVPCNESGIRDRLAAGVLKVEDLRRYLEDVLPPRMNDGGPEAAERWKTDEEAGLVDRTRVGGYPAPPDDPRFTTPYGEGKPC